MTRGEGGHGLPTLRTARMRLWLEPTPPPLDGRPCACVRACAREQEPELKGCHLHCKPGLSPSHGDLILLIPCKGKIICYGLNVGVFPKCVGWNPTRSVKVLAMKPLGGDEVLRQTLLNGRSALIDGPQGLQHPFAM